MVFIAQYCVELIPFDSLCNAVITLSSLSVMHLNVPCGLF